MRNSDLSNLTPIFELAGKEHSIAESSRVMRRAVRNHGRARRDQGTAVVGAFQIACSDESERENVEIFHTEFVRELLPKFKFWKQSSFRTANLGGRYEPGSASIAEDHYALVESQATHKVLLVKVSSHVSVSDDGSDFVYGVMDRYERASIAARCMDCSQARETTPI